MAYSEQDFTEQEPEQKPPSTFKEEDFADNPSAKDASSQTFLQKLRAGTKGAGLDPLNFLLGYGKGMARTGIGLAGLIPKMGIIPSIPPGTVKSPEALGSSNLGQRIGGGFSNVMTQAAAGMVPGVIPAAGASAAVAGAQGAGPLESILAGAVGGTAKLAEFPAAARRLVAGLLSPTKKATGQVIQSTGETLRDPAGAIALEGIIASSKKELFTKVASQRDRVGNAIDSLLQQPENEAKTLDLTVTLYRRLADRMKNADQETAKRISEVWNKVKESVETLGGDLKNATPYQSTAAIRNLEAFTPTVAGKYSTAIKEAKQDIYRSIRGMINDAVPQVAPLNKRYVDLEGALAATYEGARKSGFPMPTNWRDLAMKGLLPVSIGGAEYARSRDPLEALGVGLASRGVGSIAASTPARTALAQLLRRGAPSAVKATGLGMLRSIQAEPPNFAEGGEVKKSGMAQVEEGEFVLPRDITKLRADQIVPWYLRRAKETSINPVSYIDPSGTGYESLGGKYSPVSNFLEYLKHTRSIKPGDLTSSMIQSDPGAFREVQAHETGHGNILAHEMGHSIAQNLAQGNDPWATEGEVGVGSGPFGSPTHFWNQKHAGISPFRAWEGIVKRHLYHSKEPYEGVSRWGISGDEQQIRSQSFAQGFSDYSTKPLWLKIKHPDVYNYFRDLLNVEYSRRQ